MSEDRSPDPGPVAGTVSEADRPAGAQALFGTVARGVGEAVSKLASLAFYLVLARELGEGDYGTFIFGLAFAQALLIFAGLGAEELISRSVARDHGAIHGLFYNLVALRWLMLAGLWVAMALLLLLGPLPGESVLAILIIGLGVVAERQIRIYHAVFQAYEKNQYVAVGLVSTRFLTAVAGVTALLLGAGLVAASAIFAAGTATGNLLSRWLMRRHVVRPRREIDTSQWMSLIKRGLPLGLVAVLYLLLIRLDAILLGWLADGADNTEVGEFGAAQRLVESVMFISWAASGALLPWLARHPGDPDAPVEFWRGYEVALKALVAVLVPVAIGMAVLADPIIDLLYGAEFDDSVTPLRLLAAGVVLYGINTFIGTAMVARDRPADFTRPAIVMIGFSLVLNAILIPRYGANGAATTAIVTGSILAIVIFVASRRAFGPISPVRILAGPLLAGAAMAGAMLALGSDLTVPVLAVGAFAYPLILLPFERFVYPGDMGFYRRAAARIVN